MHAVGMSPVDLLDELCEEVQRIVAGYWLESGRQGGPALQRITVLKQLVPPKKQENSEVPFVLVYIHEGEDARDESTITLPILVGTYSEDEDGWRDAMNVAFAIRQALLAQPLLAEKYQLLLPLKYKALEQLTADARTYPVSYLQLLTSWQMAAIMPPMDEIETW